MVLKMHYFFEWYYLIAIHFHMEEYPKKEHTIKHLLDGPVNRKTILPLHRLELEEE